MALLAGAMGIGEDDERISKAYELANESGLKYKFYNVDLDRMHENSVIMEFLMKDGRSCEVIGSSIGGGQIVIRSIDGFETELTAQSSTIMITQHDRKGVVSAVSSLLTQNNINIGVMRVSRKIRGDIACCAIETDSYITKELVKAIKELKNVISVRALNINASEDNNV